MPNAETDKKQEFYIILDTNILAYLNEKTYRESVIEYLLELIKVGYTNFAVSEITIFEILSEAPKKKERELATLLDQFSRFPTDWTTCLTGAQVATAYKCKKDEYKYIETGDKSIAANSILSGAPILTANSNDFPRPFFVERHKKQIFFKDRNKDKMISLYLLSPDLTEFNFTYDNRN